MQNLSILCNAEALKRQHRETEHFFQNEHLVKAYIQNTVCVRACHVWRRTLNIKRKFKFGAACEVNSEPHIDLTLLELYFISKLLPFGCQCKLKQT